MDVPVLDCLPTVILHLTCGFLFETSPESLRALALVNRSCYHAAVPFIYQNFTIRISNRERLRQDVAKWTESHFRQQRLEYTRRIKLTGNMILLENDTAVSSNAIPAVHDHEQAELFDHVDLEIPFDSLFIVDPIEDGPDESARAWLPLASLISSIHSLTDLIYACKNQVPPSLLQALQQYHPACRLDIRTFRFRSLRDPVTDPNELAIVTSPCLHSLSVRYVWRDSWGEDDHNEEAVLRSIALAPNLKRLNMLGCSPGSSARLRDSRERPREPWKGFNPSVETFKIGSLTSISFQGYQNITKAKLDDWSKHTDLSKVRSLVLEGLIDAEALLDAAVNNRFASLERLALYLERGTYQSSYRPAVEIFFDSLRPLTTLRLYGPLDSSLIVKILQRHGKTLRELVLRQENSNSSPNPKAANIRSGAEILRIRDSCPLLEHLELQIKRSKSDWSETKCYEALGTFKLLSSLRIRLDCSNPAEPDPPGIHEDVFYRQPLSPSSLRPRLYYAHTRDALINSAIDENLARSIWQTVSKNKPGRPLKSLKLTSYGGACFGSGSASDLRLRVENLSRSFLFERSERDDSDLVNIVEIGREEREKRDERQRRDDASRMRKQGNTGDDVMIAIFGRLWPPKPESRDWRDDWSSWPLQNTPIN